MPWEVARMDVPLVAMVALIASMFAPLYALPVLAEQATPVSGPELPQPEPDIGGNATGPEDNSGDDLDSEDNPAPVVIDPLWVAPELPVVTDATCNDSAGYTQTVAAAAGPEGITYDLQIDDHGVVTVTTSLEEGSAWDAANISTNWQLSAVGLAYVDTFTLESCEVDTTKARTRGEGSALGTFNNASSTGLSISKTDNRDGPVAPGDAIVYTITVIEGGSDIYGYSFVDTLPKEVEYLWSTVSVPRSLLGYVYPGACRHNHMFSTS